MDDDVSFEVPLPAIQGANAAKYEATLEFAVVSLVSLCADGQVLRRVRLRMTTPRPTISWWTRCALW